jgi:hypothetical protein
MTMLYSSQGTITFPLAAGNTLLINNISGIETVSGSIASREDVSAVFGTGRVGYGPQTSAVTITLSSTGQCDYEIRVGDVSPSRDIIKIDPITGALDTASMAAMGATTGASIGQYNANTVMVAGDSLHANALARSGSPTSFSNRASEGWFNWLDAYLGAPFDVIDDIAVGGKTCADYVATQQAVVLAAVPKYCAISIGANDISVSFLSGEQTAANIIAILKTLMGAGIIPIWSTLFPRTYDSVVTPKIIRCNDILRLWAYNTKCGIFIDGYAGRVDPTNAQNSSRGASYSYDAVAYLHPNNLGALVQGLYSAAAVGPYILKPNAMVIGNEDVTYTNGASNLLVNPGFTGTGGTVSANCTGTMPDSWVIDWATRTGTGSAAAAIVNVTDSVSGLVIGQAIQVTISGSCAANDVIRIYQSDTQNALLKSSLSTGNIVQAEASFKMASGANVSQIAMRVQTNTTESTWWGSNAQTAVAYPATVPPMAMRTYPMAVLGAGVATQARHDLRVTFNGAGTGTVITYWQPRVRKVS